MLKCDRGKMSLTYMKSWKQCALPVITTMALWQLMHLGMTKYYKNAKICQTNFVFCLIVTVQHINTGFLCVCVCVCVCVCMYIYIYLYLYIYIYIYTNTFLIFTNILVILHNLLQCFFLFRLFYITFYSACE